MAEAGLTTEAVRPEAAAGVEAPARVARPAIGAGLLLVGMLLALLLGWAAVVPESLPVLLPMLAAAGCGGAFGLAVWRRGRAFPFFEVGSVYVAVVTLYTVYPAVGFLVNGLAYTPFNDGRLVQARPTPEAIGTIAWYHVAHLLAFVTTYVLFRGRAAPAGARVGRPDLATLLAAVLGYTTITAYLSFLGGFFDLTAASYIESYQVSSRLPLELAQLMNHLGGARFALELVILAWLFANYRRCRRVIAVWLGVMVLGGLVRLGSRTEVVLLLGAAVMMYHHFVRPVRLRQVGAAGLVGLGLFILLGLLRAGWRWSGSAGEVNPLFGYVTEFETIFANAYHVREVTLTGRVPALSPAFYWADVLALVPQQILPLAKVSPADWYVRTFFPVYAAAGGGLAFGTIPEAILAGGVLGMLARGAALGLVLACLHRYYVRRQGRLWPVILYVWATLLVYQSFRGTTFALVPLFFYRFLPVAVTIGVLAAVLRQTARRHRSGRAVDTPWSASAE